MMTEEEVRAMLRERCDRLTVEGVAAFWVGVTPCYVYDVLSGRRPPGPKILDYLRLERVVNYRRRA